MNRKKIIIISIIAAVLTSAAVSAAIIINSTGLISSNDREQGTAETVRDLPSATTPIATGASFAIAPTSLGDLIVTALSNTDLGVETDSGFLISSDVRTLTMEHLLSYLSVKSGESFRLEQQPDNAFLLHFEETLENNQVYNLVYQPPGQQAVSHAFQTADIFRVAATSPAHNSHGIPGNAGIEVTFSQELAVDFESAFSINPSVSGSFLQRDDTYIFVPTALEFNTRYTVTIAQGLRSVTGEVLTQDYTFAFNTEWGTSNAPLFSLPAGSVYETFLPWDEVFIALNVSSDFYGRNFYVNIYELRTAEDFINFTDAGSASLVDTFEIEVREFQTEWQSFYYLFLEQTLPEGYYVAEIRSAHGDVDIVLHKFIQVSALSVYSISIDGEAVFWIHDAATGQPAEGAQIRVNDTSTVTNNEGIAIVETNQNSRPLITINYGNYLPFAYTMPTFAQRNLIPSDRFLSYMYTDRPSYRPNDTVDVFGVIMPRYGHSHSPEDVFTLRFGDMLEIPIALDAYNSFAVRVPVTDMFRGMDLEVAVNGERLMSRWISFFDYTNLSFVLDGGLDKIAYFPGEYAQAEISVTTFAEMPAEGISLQHGWSDNAVTMTTNSEGIAAMSMLVPQSSGWMIGWVPQWSSFWFSVTSGAQMSQSISLPKIIVPADIMMEHEYDGGDTATITTNRILIDRINQHYADAQAWSSLDLDVFRGPSVDIDFRVEITQHVTTRTIRHTNYDHINRRTINVYDFHTTDSHYGTIPGRTQNGEAVITGLPVSNDPLIRYSIEIKYEDSAGRESFVRLLDNQWRHIPQESSIRNFGLVLESNNLRVNETTRVSLRENPHDNWFWGGTSDDSIAVTDGRLLTILYRDRIISATVGSPRGVPVTFTEECISSAMIFGAYFDETYIFPIANPVTVTYDYSERELEMELDFDKDRYQPGDEVTVTIQASAQAQVLISVVDESSILHSWHEANFLSRLYHSSWGWWPAFHQFASHTQHNFGGAGGGAEGGGGGDEGGEGVFRDRFIDNPIFEIVQTDGNGRGSFTFTLPDQVTSWRVTAIGLTRDGFAGDAQHNIISHLDFYVDLMLTSEYIVGDDIAAVARAFGSGDAPVNFTFNILQGGTTIHSDSQVSGRNATFNAGKLGVGDYIMQVTATYGTHRDAVELPFTVAETGMILPMRATARIADAADTSAITELSMRSLPVRVTLTNADIGPIVRVLTDIRNDNSFRTDYIAATAYIDYFFTGIEDFDNARLRIPQTAWGGIPELTYEDGNFFYTARFAASFPEFVNHQRIITYIRNEMRDASAEKRAAGLLALASLGEPVLFEIQNEARNATYGLTKLYLTAALVAIGDDAGAAALAKDIPVDFGQNSSITERETVNTLWLFINTTINPIEAWAYLSRNAVNANAHVSNVPERINFVKRTRILGATISEVQYHLNGTTHTARLEDFERLSLHLTKEQFDALNLVPISGATDFHIDFFGYDAENWDAADNRIGIQRTIIRDGDLFRVDLHVTAEYNDQGFYTVYDRLPSNLRFVPLRQRGESGNHYFVRHTQRQLVEVSFLLGGSQPLSRTVSYYAMELFDADMADGTTYVSNRFIRPHVWGMTE